MSFAECMATGRSAEQRFVGHLTNPVFSNKEQDIQEHWDVRDDTVTYDVKAMKKWRRSDPAPTDRIHYIEIRNVQGELGWLYGQADFIAFESRSHWIVVDRTSLIAMVESATEKAQLTPNPQVYQYYQREGRKDLMTVVPTMDLLAISNQVKRKYNNE